MYFERKLDQYLDDWLRKYDRIPASAVLGVGNKIGRSILCG